MLVKKITLSQLKKKVKNPIVVQHWVSQTVFSMFWNTEYVPFNTCKETFWQQNTWTSEGEWAQPGKNQELPSSVPMYMNLHQKLWPRLTVGLSSAHDPIEKNSSELCPGTLV